MQERPGCRHRDTAGTRQVPFLAGSWWRSEMQPATCDSGLWLYSTAPLSAPSEHGRRIRHGWGEKMPRRSASPGRAWGAEEPLGDSEGVGCAGEAGQARQAAGQRGHEPSKQHGQGGTLRTRGSEGFGGFVRQRAVPWVHLHKTPCTEPLGRAPAPPAVSAYEGGTRTVAEKCLG